jgi:hypothetical protein
VSDSPVMRRSILLLATCLLVVSSCAGSGRQRSGSAVPPGSTALGDGPNPTYQLSASKATLDATSGRFETGEFHGIDIWVDPVNGSDDHDGAQRATAMRTVRAAWLRIPVGVTLTTGYRLRLVAGAYPVDTSVNYWENHHGTAAAPIIIEAADGPHTAVFSADMNVFDVSYLYVLGVDIIREGDAFHCERCDHLLIRDAELSGGTGAHDLLKVNQSQYVFVEGNDIHGADDNAVDFVAVQYGHVIGNRIHDSQDWCMYAKGGSAYLTLASNDVYDCGTGGITAGQGTGFEFMQTPWLNYEAYGIRIVDNTIHHTQGAGLGVAGGYDILLAYNTLYRVGGRSHAVEFVRGRRGCDGNAAVCTAHHDAGGWGSSASEEQFIPNRHVLFYDNVVVNPPGATSQWQHFQIDGPVAPPAGSGTPSPALADDDLRIVGNVLWNGPPDLVLGTGDGCADTNPTCTEALIRAANVINTVQVTLVDPENGDFRLTDAILGALPVAVVIPALEWGDAPTTLVVPAGATDTAVTLDQTGAPRTATSRPGAL